MATLYWFGGAGTWNTSSVAHWGVASGVSGIGSKSGTTITTTTSPAWSAGMTVYTASGAALGDITGGSGNSWSMSTSGTQASTTMYAQVRAAAAPTSADTVAFDNGSGTGTINASSAVCGALTSVYSGASRALSGTLTCNGSFNISNAALTTGTLNLTMAGTTNRTLTLASGASLSSLTLTGAHSLAFSTPSVSIATFTCGVNATVSLGSGTVNFGTVNMTSGTLNCQTANITLASSPTFNVFNANTSTITLTNSMTLSGSRAYNKVVLSGGDSFTFSGSNTFNDLTINKSGITTLIVANTQTMTNFISADVGNAANRVHIKTNTQGQQKTLAITFASIADVDFRDIVVSGSALTGTRLGDGGNNSNITFTAPKTVYWVSSGTINWSLGSWASSSGGAPSLSNFPLAQDTAVFDNTNSGTATIDQPYFIPSINASGKTTGTTMYIIFLNTAPVVGNLSFGAATSASSTILFQKYGDQTITATTAQPAIPKVEKMSGSLVLNSNVTMSDMVLNGGTINLNGFTLTVPSLTVGTISGTNATNVTFNGGTLALTASNALAFYNATYPQNFTTTAGTGTGKMSFSGSLGKKMTGGGCTFNCTVENVGADALAIADNNTITTLSNASSPSGFIFAAGSTNTITNFNVSGTSGNLVTITSDSAGSAATLLKSSGTVSVSYCSIQDSTATGGALWNAYTTNGNVDSGNNTGWIFAAPGSGLFFGSNF